MVIVAIDIERFQLLWSFGSVNYRQLLSFENVTIIRLFLQIANEVSNDSKNNKNYYNCEKKRHILKNCFELKQNNSQINIVKNSRQNIQQDEQKTLSSRFIIEISNNLKN